jgi:hypothetical protein
MSQARTHHDSSHATAKSETYSAESIVHELKNKNTLEAARELNRDLHSSKDFNDVYKKANDQISQYNKTHTDQLPALQLVNDKGETAGKDDAKGIKIANTTYGTDTVYNNKTVDEKTGNQTVRAGDTAKTLNTNGDQVQTDADGKTTTTFSDANKDKHKDKDLGQVKSETKDGKGHTILTGDNGNTKTVDDVTHKETIDYANGDRIVNRPDGSGCKIIKDNGVTKIHSWSQDGQKGNYDVTISPSGDYTKTGKDWGGMHNYSNSGHGYEFQPDEK